MYARIAPVLLVLGACTVYRVPEGGDSESGASASSAGTSGDPSSSGGAPSTSSADTSSSTTSTTTTTTTTSGDPSSSSSPGTTDEPPPLECDFPTSVQPIFDAKCGCHQGDMPPKGLDLKAGAAFDSLVGVDSMEQPGTPRVDPNNSGGSYLALKIGGAPPQGDPMPPGGPLAPEDVTLIKAWIDAGAPEAGAFVCDGEGGGGSVTIDEPGPYMVEVGELVDLDLVVLDGQGQPVPNPTISWASSDEAILYVDSKGTLLGITPGSVQVTGTANDIESDPVVVEVKANTPTAAPFTDVLAVTSTRCGCHKSDMPKAGLAFDKAPADLHADLLAPSTQQAMIPRVTPGAPGQSYLFLKLTRTAPPTGAQMPQGKAPLEAEKVQVVLRWILDGAPP